MSSDDDLPSPPRCRACGVDTVVRLEHITSDSIVILAWHCLHCHAHWPPTSQPGEALSDERDGPSRH